MAFDYAPKAFEYSDVPPPDAINAVLDEFEEYYTYRAEGGFVGINPLHFTSAQTALEEVTDKYPIEFVELDASIPYSSKLNIYQKGGDTISYGLYGSIPETPPLAIKTTTQLNGTTTETPMTVEDLAVMVMTVTNHRAAQTEAGDL